MNHSSIPNLFTLATSELSQDAFFAWLLSWANTNADPGLKACALDLLRVWTGDSKLPLEGERPVQVIKQYKNIDLLVLVNGIYAIVIEDKTETAHHSGQLERYQKEKLEGYKDENYRYVYLKSRNACDFSYYEVSEKKGYTPFKRADMLAILKPERSSNNIYRDFVAYLQQLEEQTNAPIESKSGYSVQQLQGFFMHLENEIRPPQNERIRYSWHSVNTANPFWAFTFGWRDFDGYQIYWQFDIYPDGKAPNRLVCKAHVQDESKVNKADLKAAALATFTKLNPEEKVNDKGNNRLGKHLSLFEWVIDEFYPGQGLRKERAVEIVKKGTLAIDTLE
ncbi:MAG: hypothetical protein C0424_09440 [Sphingobacteriaceae bacterium]|nr:hypothetical protein [Sphingobacteriaceae bacterium]